MSDLVSSKPYGIVDVSEYVTDEIRKTFGNLEIDDYHPDGTRFRRFSQFRMSSSHSDLSLERLPVRPFSQKVVNNQLVGNTLRYFPPILVDIGPLILAGFKQTNLPRNDDWQVNCHQVRVQASSAVEGRAAPEGVHRDGVDYIFMVCMDRVNIAGGKSEIYSDQKELLLSTELQPGSGLVVNDAAVYHNVTAFRLDRSDQPGWRDMFIIAYMPWHEGRYGPDYEIRVTGKAADQRQIEAVACL